MTIKSFAELPEPTIEQRFDQAVRNVRTRLYFGIAYNQFKNVHQIDHALASLPVQVAADPTVRALRWLLT